MTYTKDDVGERPGRDPLTDAEKQQIADEWNANETAKPLENWFSKMRDSDIEHMPRWAEELVAAIVDGAQLSQQTTDKMRDKKSLRLSRPK